MSTQQQQKKPTPTLPEFEAWACDCAPAGRAVLMAQAFAETTRQHVDAYIRPIFDAFAFEYSGDLASRLHLSGPIPTPNELYLCGDGQSTDAYYAECDRIHKAHGSTLPTGHCPALHAEMLLTQTENALIELAAPLFGVHGHELCGENRRRYLDLLIGACLKDGAA